MLKKIYEILCKSVGYRPSAMITTSEIGFSLKESLKETNMIVQGVDLMDLYNDLQQKIKELNISIKKLRETGSDYAEAEKGDFIQIDINQYLEMYNGSEKQIILIARPTCHYCQIAEPILQNLVYEYKLNINY